MAKRHLAGDVLKRLSRSAPRYVAAQHLAFLQGKRLFKMGIQIDAPHTARVGQQPLRRDARVLIPLALKIAHRPVESRLDGPDIVFSRGDQVHAERFFGQPFGFADLFTHFFGGFFRRGHRGLSG